MRSSLIIPMGTFLLAMLLALLARSPYGFTELRAAGQETRKDCHEFSAEFPDPLCVGLEPSGTDTKCEALIVPNPQAGVIGEIRETRLREESGRILHTFGARAGGHVTPGRIRPSDVGSGDGPRGDVPLRMAIVKDLTLIGKEEDCPDLPHDMISKAEAVLRTRIQIDPPLRGGRHLPWLGLLHGAGRTEERPRPPTALLQDPHVLLLSDPIPEWKAFRHRPVGRRWCGWGHGASHEEDSRITYPVRP